MLVGLSALTAVALRVFFARQEQVGTPFTLCPDNPQNCPAYVEATRASVIVELQVIFAGAALTAAVAAVLSAVLLTAPGRPPAEGRSASARSASARSTGARSSDTAPQPGT
jgi:hypothetical protein